MVLALTFQSPTWQTEDHERGSRADPPLGKRESRLRSAEIHGELLKLGFNVSERTISRYLRHTNRRGDPGKSWLTFLRNRREAIVRLDFLTVPTFTFRLCIAFSSTNTGAARSLNFNVTLHPTADWVVQQLREAFPGDQPYRYAILDRDSRFNIDVISFLKSTGLNRNESLFDRRGRMGSPSGG